MITFTSMILSERQAKWLLNLYPPLLLQRVRVKHIGPGFRTAEVRILKSILNRNYNKSIFGGTIFSAADPLFLLMYWQILRRKGIKVKSWLKSARIEYKKPGDTLLTAKFELQEEDIAAAELDLLGKGKFTRWHKVYVLNRRNEVCALVETEVYMRRLP